MRFAMASPRPFAPPVMIATLPDSRVVSDPAPVPERSERAPDLLDRRLRLEGETFVVVGGDFVALLPVGADAAEVRHEDAGFTGDVRSHVPGGGLREQRRVGHLLRVGRPLVLGLSRWLDDIDAELAHVGDDPRDELDVLLYGDRHVRKHRGAAGTGYGEHVGEARDRQPEVGARTLDPLIPQQLPAPAADIYLVERAGHRVEAGGVNEDVELVLGVFGPQAGRGDL